MVPVRDNPPVAPPERRLLELRCGLMEERPPPLDSAGSASAQERRTPAAQPALRCGWCHAVIVDVGLGTTARCDHCHHSVRVPSYIRVTCDRCRHHRRIRPREVVLPQLCAHCGAQLVIGDVILEPRRGRHVQRHRHHHHLSPAYADAAWAVLIIGLALVVVLLALMR